MKCNIIFWNEYVRLIKYIRIIKVEIIMSKFPFWKEKIRRKRVGIIVSHITIRRLFTSSLSINSLFIYFLIYLYLSTTLHS